MDKLRPEFYLNKIVKVDDKVCNSGRARIVGCEWGPDNKFLMARHKGWVYTLREIGTDGVEIVSPAGLGMGFEVSEEELLKWNQP